MWDRIASAAYRVVLRALLPCFLSGLHPNCLFALADSTRLSQSGHTAWRLQDGVFDGVPNAIAQTTDGYLWIGTSNGLTRFDGVRFVSWKPPSGMRFPNLNIASLLGSSDGGLWIGTGSGFARLQNGKAYAYPDAGGRAAQIVQDQHGSIWVGRTRVTYGGGPLCQITGITSHCFGKADGIPAPYISTLSVDQQGFLWLGHSTSLTRWKPGSATVFEIPSLKSAEGLDGLGATLVNSDGSLLVGLPRSGPGLGLQQLAHGQWRPFTVPGLDGSELQVSALLKDRNGSLWIGTVGDGVVHVTKDSVDHYRSTDGLSSDGVKQLFEDREGNVWVVTSLGVDRFRDLKVLTFAKAEGLSSDVVQSVLASRDGGVWIGNFGALDFIKDGHISSLAKKTGLPGVRVTSLLEDRAGALWVGIDNQLYTYEHKRFSKIEPPDRLQLGTVISMAQDKAGDVWVATASPLALLHINPTRMIDRSPTIPVPPVMTVAASARGGIFLGLIDGRLGWLHDGKLELFTIWASNPEHHRIGSFTPNPDGSVWGNSTGGLVAWKNGQSKILDEKNGLPCKRVNASLMTANGDLWLSQPCGFTKIPHDQLESSWSSDVPHLKVETLDVFDGAQTGRSVFAPSATVSNDGKLWFANESVLQMIDPATLRPNSSLPPVHVEEVIADHRSYSSAASLRLPSHTRDVEIDYSALSLAIPQKVHFRYKLEGWDNDWQDPGTRRQAFYTNLRPRSYTFRVIASNNDGLWNESGSSLAFVIPPAFYQTKWFLVCLGMAAALLLYLFYWLRLRQITGEIKARMLERLSERERIARDLHDTFFQGIQGLLLRFNSATSKLDATEPARALFIEALEQSDRVMLEGRELVLDLRAVSTDTVKLPEALAQAGEDFQGIGHSDFRVTVTGQSRELHGICAGELYRIGREALYNSFIHADASKIEAEIHYQADTLKLRIMDNGVGIDDHVLRDGMRAGHLGLPGMQERAHKLGGTLTILSAKGGGTEIEVAVPATVAYLPASIRLVPGWRAGWMHKSKPLNGGRNG